MRYAEVTERLAGLGSDKWTLFVAATARKRAGQPVIDLTIGEPDTATPDHLIRAATSAMQAGRTGYSNGRGEPEALAALSARYSEATGRQIGADRFLCLPGTQTALYVALMALCDPGCEVILGDPMYATYEGLIRAAGARPVPVALRPEHGFRLQAVDVAARITPATRAILLNTPHNPTGAILSLADLDALLATAARHDLWVISDEVYGNLTHDGAVFTSALADPAHEARVVVASSISKSHAATGFRAGWLCGSAEFCARSLPLSETMLFGSQPFIADMMAEALASPPTSAQAMAARMARRARIVHEALDGVAGLRVHRPQAGMFALVNIRALSRDSQAFALDLLHATGVAVMPGASFGTALEGWLRLALTASDDTTREACARLARFAEGCRP
ncbi:pyridoxal phosphate-dependent aminotransferase [Roseovarius autotrophicus]|uniref:pyridoxal phosphate-dependent aminotransferase n=1 Tax=Roseovarius autotrophicus TaxID=2824121 RepID=UPI0019FFF09B|nr:pyridoxal phosphate-dependent aminotransferase [Roseovarius autotrophicus]MBE0453141.1 pyridoxal phosphate-dependent aminotransferase [Roseovarius sp.]